MSNINIKKRNGYRLSMKTLVGESGQQYLVMNRPDGGYNVFVEVEAKAAAKDCGAKGKGNTRDLWDRVWY